ncbi:MAG: hypothetical protein AB1649_02715 [Chloroflexota bacterium]
MTLPSLLFALAIGLLLGALYHILRGGSRWRLVAYLGLGVLGFAIGQVIGAWRGWYFIMAGPLNLGMGSLGSLILLIAGDWLGRGEVKREGRV